MLTDLYLIRHGQPGWSPPGTYNVLPGPDLSDHGRNEAHQAARFLAERSLTRLFSSPFARTAQTAEIVGAALDLPLELTDLVQEHGPGEDFAQVRTRMQHFLGSLLEGDHARVGMVSHGSPIRAALLELSHEKIDLREHVYPGGNPAPTCGIWHIKLIDARTRHFELAFRPENL